MSKIVSYAIIKGLENENNLNAEMSKLRKQYFKNNNTAKIVSEDDFNGYNAKTKAKLTKFIFTYVKIAERIAVEKVSKTDNVFVLTRLDINGGLCGKVFYDKNYIWLKTEYYSLADSLNFSHMIKPNGDDIELYIKDKKVNLKPHVYDDKTRDLFLRELNGDENCVIIEFDDVRKIYLEKEILARVCHENDDVDTLELDFETVIEEKEILKVAPVTEKENNFDITDKLEAEVVYDEQKEYLVVYKYFGGNIKSEQATLLDKNGKLIYSGGYINSKREGFGIEYNDNGTILYEGNFKNDKYAGGTLHTKIDLL